MEISREVAEEQLDEFLGFYEIELDILPGDQKAAVDGSVKKIISAILKGRVEVLSNGEIRQVFKNPPGDVPELIYRELTGSAKLAMKGKGAEDYHGRIYALLGSLAGVDEAAISKLRGVDLSIAECIGVLFLQV